MSSSPTPGGGNPPFGSSQKLPKPSDNHQRRQQNRTTSSDIGNLRSAPLQQMIRDTNEASRRLDEESMRRVSNQIAAMKLEIPKGPKEILQRMLSLRTVVSTSSSGATEQQIAVVGNVGYRRIGFGMLGIVFEKPGTGSVLKVAKDPTHLKSMLWNDFLMQHNVFQSFNTAGELDVKIPKPWAYLNEGFDDVCKTWWRDNLEKFPENLNMKLPSHAIEMERIFPLPKVIRGALIDLFCPDDLKYYAHQDPANRDCIARIYLGKRSTQLDKTGRMFTLRNFNLTLNHIEEMGVDPREWAGLMGRALAILHWEAEIDAHDVEFVLGSSPSKERPVMSYAEVLKLPQYTQTLYLPNFKRRIVDMWVLDFNNCSPLKGDKTDIEHMVWTFYWNDPYFPLPEAVLSKDQELWKIFSEAYLDKSVKILALKPEKQKLPELFVDAVVDREKEKIRKGFGHGWREPREF